MPQVILIGFEYLFNSQRLPGVFFDIYHSYKYFDSFNYDIIIITDISNLYDTNLFKK